MGNYRLKTEDRRSGFNFTGTGFVFARDYDYRGDNHFELEAHQHDWHEFVWARCPETRGEPHEYVLDGVRSAFSDGTLLYSPPFHPHSFSVRGALRNYVIGIDETQIRKMFSRSPLALPLDRLFASWRNFPSPVLTRAGLERDGIQTLMDGVSGIRHKPGSLDSLDALHFLVSLDRAITPWKANQQKSASSQGAAGSAPIVKAAIEFLERNFASAVGVQECAEAIGVARSTLSHQFQAATGLSLPRWLSEIRLRNARAMLVETDLTVLEIALECGFNDQAWFSRQFRAAMGLSPSEWRVRARAMHDSSKG
jgi:AraC-like DNA-binding protein